MRLDWLGSEALSWRDLLVIVTQSPPDSAIIRAIQPESYEMSQIETLIRRVEFLAVLIQRGNFLSAMNDVPESKLPHIFEDLFAPATAELTDEQEDRFLAAIEAHQKAWEVADDGGD